MTGTVAGHYTTGTLMATLLDAVRAAGHDPDRIDPEVLGPVEEFHVLGRQATVALADAAKISAGERVLDVGCGIGGASRYLHRTFGSQVTGVDVTEEFCEAARDLNRRTGMGDAIEVRQANALDLPFPDNRFDVAWTMHVAMNIEDKAGLYRELHRVLRPGGRLAFFDIVAGPVEPLHFPVPWAAEPSISFLLPLDGLRAAVEGAGFTVDVWTDASGEAATFFAALTASATAPPPIGLHLLVPDFATRAGNARRNLEEDRIRLLRCVASA